MQNQLTQPFSQRYTLLFKGLVYTLVTLYLVNCLSPLRLHVDMLRYFAIKDCIELGCPPDSEAAKDYLPFGYTALLLALSKIGLLKSWAIVLINCVYLAGALYLVKKIFESSLHLLFFVVLVLLNWTTIKFIAHPLSEMQYLFFSMASIYFFYSYTKSKKILSLLLAFGFGGVAFITRSVGIALAAALVVSLVWQYRKELILLIQKNRIIAGLGVIIIIGVAIFSKQLGLNHYTGVFTKQFDEGVGLATILQWHFTEWAELSFNTSSVKLLPYLPVSMGKWLFVLAGIVFFAGFVYLLFFRRNDIPFIIKAYLFFYSLLMFTWPFYDPRFWVPVFPLIIAIIIKSPNVFSRPVIVKRLAFVFAIAYALIGLMSVGYMTYTSLNKKVFAKTQANGVYRNEYETFFFGKAQSDTARLVNPTTINVLKRYNK